MHFLKFLKYAAFIAANLDTIREFAKNLVEKYHGDNPMAASKDLNSEAIQAMVDANPELAAAADEVDGPSIARNRVTGVFADLVKFILENPELFFKLLDRFFPQGNAKEPSPGEPSDPSTAV